MAIFEMAFKGLEENMVGKGNSIMVKDDPPEVFLKSSFSDVRTHLRDVFLQHVSEH